MAVTFNRRPLSINIPSSSDTKQNYFNHFNWKGINQDKNFLSVDQETFADAKNVYIDEQGLLKSRLPVKYLHSFGDKIIKDIKVLGDTLICAYVDSNGEWFIGVIESGEWIIDIKGICCPVKAFKNGPYVYIFTDEKIITYDSVTKNFSDANLYNPITRMYVGEKHEDLLEPNVFSDYQTFQYTLNSSENDNSIAILNQLRGKTISYRHDFDFETDTHTIKVDDDLTKLVHQQLFTQEQLFMVNAFGNIVPSLMIFGEFIYRINGNVLEKASLSDLNFSPIYVEMEYNSNDFVKLKTATSGDRIMMIYRTGVRIFDIADNLISENTLNFGSGSIILDVDYNNFVYYSNNKYSTSPCYSLVVLDEQLKILLPDLNDVAAWKTVYLGHYYDDLSIRSATAEIRGGGNNPLIANYDSYYNQSMAINFSINSNHQVFNDVIFIPDLSRYTINGIGNVIGLRCNRGLIVNADDLYARYIPIDDEYGEYYLTGTDVASVYFEKTGGDNSPSLYANLKYADSFQNYGRLYTVNEQLYFEKSISTLDEQYCNGKDLYVLRDSGLYYVVNDELESFISSKNVPLAFSSYNDYWLGQYDSDLILSNYRNSSIDLYYEYADPFLNEYNGVDLIVKENKIYLSKDNKFYIGEIVNDVLKNEESLYFRKSDKYEVDLPVTGIHRISDTEMAIFTSDSTWYNVYSDGIYYYYCSKIVPTLKNKSSLITIPDSTTTLMPSTNGIIALSYQNFVNTSEQSTINLTQNIVSMYNKFDGNIRSINWKWITLFYTSENNCILLYDNRNQSWWWWELPFDINVLFVYDNTIYIATENCLYLFNDERDEYFDELSSGQNKIDWFVESQKLHLNSHNYYKHISNLTLCSVQENECPVSLNLNIKNYRKWVNNGKAENFDYRVDVIRTFIKRLNYAKVCEFQYKLSSDKDAVLQSPLALSNITIKYKIGGQIR